MAQQKGIRATWFFYSLIFYVLAAGIWWCYLLYIKNEDALEAKKTALWYELRFEGMENPTDYLQHPDYLKLTQGYQTQSIMIIGEGLVLFIIMIIGISIVYQSRQREIALARQQQNFLLSITHELKSPIASIRLALETFQRRRLSEVQQQKLSHNAIKDTERLHNLVQDMLLAARIEGGHEYNFEATNLISLCREVITLVAHKYEGEIRTVFPSQPIYVQAERHTLLIALSNVLENAVKYAPDSEFIEIRIQHQGQKAQLQIIDLGAGIPKSEQQKIFNKFYRVGQEHTRKTKGTGLGLYIVKQVIKAHGGQVQVKDNKPHGSIFQIILPASLESESMTPSENA